MCYDFYAKISQLLGSAPLNDADIFGNNDINKTSWRHAPKSLSGMQEQNECMNELNIVLCQYIRKQLNVGDLTFVTPS